MLSLFFSLFLFYPISKTVITIGYLRLTTPLKPRLFSNPIGWPLWNPSWFDGTSQWKRSMSNGAFAFHAHTHNSLGVLGNLVLLLCNKTDSSGEANYNLLILVLGDVHRLQFDSNTKAQKIRFFAVLHWIIWKEDSIIMVCYGMCTNNKRVVSVCYS